jgi:hypothetical protein
VNRVPDAGRCAGCAHRRVVRGARSEFLQCGLAAVDPSYPRYPRLPVLICAGFTPERPTPAPASE